MWDITLGTKRIKVILFFFFLTFMKIEVKKIKWMLISKII